MAPLDLHFQITFLNIPSIVELIRVISLWYQNPCGIVGQKKTKHTTFFLEDSLRILLVRLAK